MSRCSERLCAPKYGSRRKQDQKQAACIVWCGVWYGVIFRVGRRRENERSQRRESSAQTKGYNVMQRWQRYFRIEYILGASSSSSHAYVMS